MDKASYNNNAELADKIIERYVNKQYDKVLIYYNKFKNAANQIAKVEQILPVKKKQKEQENNKTTSIDYILNPEKELLSSII